jgi:hypothetical protein
MRGWFWFAVLVVGLAGFVKAQQADCVNIRSPSSNWTFNTLRIQQALDHASSIGSADLKACVSVGGKCLLLPSISLIMYATHAGGDFPVERLFVKNFTLLRIEEGTRLVNVVNVTQVAVLSVFKAVGVKIEGGGTIYGNAENMWSGFSKTDDRMSPYYPDGSPNRTSLLLVDNSRDVEVRDIKLHNASEWTFRLGASRDIW